MITFADVTVTYADASAPTLRAVDLAIDEGELCLVVGATGAGKSTLLRCINGLVPHFTGGELTGSVFIDGRDTRIHPPRELADVVGYVGQDPTGGFVTDIVEDELAFGMESLSIRPDVMRRRVEETLDLLGLAPLRDRSLLSLSAGERQRVAIGSVLTMHPRVLVLDEPTSALDPGATEEVLAVLTRLVHDTGLTVVLAEHRLERVVEYADRVVLLDGSGRAAAGSPGEMLAADAPAPPVVELGRRLGWQPPPLSVRDARRRAGQLRTRLRDVRPGPAAAAREEVATLRSVVVRHGDVVALREVDLSLHAGEVVAVMGRNGAGKSSLLGALAGIVPATGTVTVCGQPVAGRPPREVTKRVGLVPSDPGDLLWAQAVGQECGDADQDANAAVGTTRALLDRLAPGIPDDRHPRDLSEGQRLALALAIVLAAAPTVLALDEPTRGLDYAAKDRLGHRLRELSAAGHCVVLATHDVELVAHVADRIVVLAEGDVVADGPVRDIATSSPMFAPQVAKVMAPIRLLTVDEVMGALA